MLKSHIFCEKDIFLACEHEKTRSAALNYPCTVTYTQKQFHRRKTRQIVLIQKRATPRLNGVTRVSIKK